MGLPRNLEARLFYGAAWQRYEDADALLAAGRHTGAVYLAGYAVECMFKSLILSRLGAKDRSVMMDGFRGVRGHNLESLKDRFERVAGIPIPGNIARNFYRVNNWTTDIRYQTRALRLKEALAFVEAVQQILNWADARL